MRSTLIFALVCATVPVSVLAQSRAVGTKSTGGAAAAAPARSAVLSVTSDANEPRVELDLDNATVRDALKQLFDQAKQSYKIDEDVPDSSRVTVRAKNVRFSTALELILQAAGVGLARQVEEGKLVYRIRKSGADTLSTLDLLRSAIDSKMTMTLDAPRHLEQFLRATPDGKWVGKLDPKELELQLRMLHGAMPKGGTVTGQAIPYVFSVHEQRSIFRCPHCKGQATVIRQQEQPKCEKCSRVFQSGWQFCPADGTKRPAAAGEWKYCPFCSKKVEGEKGAGVPVLEDIPFIGSLFRTAPAPVAPAAPPALRAPGTVPAVPATPGELARPAAPAVPAR